MPGTYVTDQQVRLFMSKRKHHTQEVAAAMAGMSVRLGCLSIALR